MAARSKSDEAFANRLAQHGEELEELFTSLYGDAEALESLRELMNEAHAARPADLKRLDTKRVADPEWYKRGNMFGMTMYTTCSPEILRISPRRCPISRSRSLPTCI